MPSLAGFALFPRKPCSLQPKNAPIAFSMFMLNRTAQGTTLSLLFEAGSWSFLGISATRAALSYVSMPHTENRRACPSVGRFHRACYSRAIGFRSEPAVDQAHEKTQGSKAAANKIDAVAPVCCKLHATSTFTVREKEAPL